MAWYHRLLNTARPERLSRDLDRELEFHLAERADELMAGGMGEAEARRQARLRFGGDGVHRERTRERDVLPWLESLAADVRYALRSLRANPGFAGVAVLSLGLGIGANTAIFSLMDAVMLRALPVDRPEELVLVTMGGPDDVDFTNPLWEEVRDRQDVFAGAFAYSEQRFDLAGGGEVRPVEGAWVSGGFFGTLGVAPAAGRLLGAADDFRGCPAVAVLGHGFWQSAYGGSAGAVGRTVSLNGHPFQIVGVAARGFTGVEVGKAAQVFAPLCARAVVDGGDGGLDQRSFWFLRIVGRRAEGVTEAGARARLAALAPAVFGATVPPDWDDKGKREYAKNTLDAVPAASGYSGLRVQYRDALLALAGVVGLVLLIACANVANLLLARATVRRREVAIRLAIGAGRGRLVRQLLTESLLLALLGGAVGLVFASWASGLLVRLLSTRANAVRLDLGVDGRLLAFTLAVTTATAVLFGLAPAWRATRVDPHAAMQATGRSVAEGHSRFTLGRALVVGQIALSLVLVLGAGLLLGTFRRLATLDPGFRSEGVLLASLNLRGTGLPDERLPALKREILEAVRATPGVRSASASAITPVSGAAWNGRVVVDGYTPARRDDDLVFFNSVSEGFFATMGTPLLAGRDFDRGDAAGSETVAVINEAMARRFFAGASPLGRRIEVDGPPGQQKTLRVVGVVGNTKYRSLREETEPLVYLSMAQDVGAGPPMFSLELRTAGPPAALAPAVTAAVGGIDRGVSLRYATLREQVDGSLTQERLLATLSGFFGGLALLLAAVGLYGTMAYSVARRRGEIGIRIALGAARARVVRLVLGEVGRMLLAGVALGMLAAAVMVRRVAPFLFGLAPSDPATWALSALTLAAAAAAAGALPAWRAARVDPMDSLREE
jgi:putative ABC transport system permease protein